MKLILYPFKIIAMKKYLVFIFLFMSLYYSIGQKIDWGIQIGGGVSNQNSKLTNFNSSSDIHDYLNRKSLWSPSYSFDLVLNAVIKNKFGLETSIGYIRKGVAVKNPGVTSQLDYLHLPILLTYKFGNRWSVVTGPEIGYAVASFSKAENADRVRNKFLDLNMELSILAGLQYAINHNFSIGCRFNQDLTTHTKFKFTDQNGDEVGTMRTYNKYLQLMLKYQL